MPLLFQGSARGVSAPLVASGQLFGAINVEYPEGLEADVAPDERVLMQLANQVAVAVRNAKLIDELTFVRKYLEELLENANALILVANRERQGGRLQPARSRSSPASRKDEVLGKDLLAFMPESERMRVMRVFARGACKGEPVTSFETRCCARTAQRGARRLRHLDGAHASRARSRASSPSGRTSPRMASWSGG